jgi:hypothetical protein
MEITLLNILLHWEKSCCAEKLLLMDLNYSKKALTNLHKIN